MSNGQVFRSLLSVASASLLLGPSAALAATTICTELIRGSDGSIPVDERESFRQVESRVLPAIVDEGDKLASEGNPAGAVAAYAKALAGGFSYRGTYHGAGRCLPTEVYQQVADKVRDVASELAALRLAKGYMLDESHEYGGEFQRGALGVYLLSNQYDEFGRQAIAYAESELRERDIDRELSSLVLQRLDELQRKRDVGSEAHNRQLVNDLTPLLEEELAAFDKLAGFAEKLAAHLAPLYPRIADERLAEEARYHEQLLATDALLPQMALHAKAKDSLQNGIDRLREHPVQVERLKARADERGHGFLTAGRFEMAEDYFDVAGNETQRERAGALAERQQEKQVGEMIRGVEADLRNMQKSDDEKAAFEKEAEDMAAEFGFDLDDSASEETGK